jgi:hypothetical protein
MIGIEQYQKIQEYKELGLDSDKNVKDFRNYLQFCLQVLEHEQRRLCKGG